MVSQKTIAVFDFDETLITLDTLPDFIRFATPLPVLIIKSISFVPTLLLFVTHQINNQVAKENTITKFFAGMPESDFISLGNRYATRLQRLASKEAIDRVKWHKNQGHKVVIVSASIKEWIAPWAASIGISEVISTEVEKKNSVLTGKLETPNCHGEEKVRRFLEENPNRNSYKLYVYGDGKSDKEMFKLADKYYEKSFK